PSTSRLSSNSLSESGSLAGSPSRLSSNSLLDSSFFFFWVGLPAGLEAAGEGPLSSDSSNEPSSLLSSFFSSDTPLSAGLCRLMPLLLLPPPTSPRATSSSAILGSSSLRSSSSEDALASPGVRTKSSLLSSFRFFDSLSRSTSASDNSYAAPAGCCGCLMRPLLLSRLPLPDDSSALRISASRSISSVRIDESLL